MNKKRALTLVGLVVLVMALGVGGAVLASQPGEPLPGTVQGIRGPNTFWNGTVIAGSTVTYTSAPKLVYGSDVSLVWLYHNADIFVTADITPSSYLTITPQFSVDQSNWADATYTYVAQPYTTTVSAAVTEASYQIAMSADGTDYLRIPLAGKYLRFKIEHSDTVTPTINVMLRND